MNRTALRYFCRSCQREHTSWHARCDFCREWGIDVVSDALPRAHLVPPTDDDDLVTSAPRASITTRVVDSPPRPRLVTTPVDGEASAMDGPIPMSEVPDTAYQRDLTGIGPLDAVLGGGIAVGSVVVLGGLPGIGKSSLMKQALAGLQMRVLYATGEESVSQAVGGARRVGAASSKVFIVAETDLDMVLAHARAIRAQIIAIDSIQTLVCADLSGGPGSPGQVKACANRLVKLAKATDTSVLMVGHVTNDGGLAGPQTLKHIVDVLLDLDAGPGFDGDERVLRCAGKNRFGPSNVIGQFRMTDGGLVPFDDEEADG